MIKEQIKKYSWIFLLVLCFFLQKDQLMQLKTLQVIIISTLFISAAIHFQQKSFSIYFIFIFYILWLVYYGNLILNCREFNYGIIGSEYWLAVFLHFLIWLCIFTVINHPVLTSVIGIFFSGILSLVNYYVYVFRGNGIILDDIRSLNTAMNVAVSYHVQFDSAVLSFVCFLVLLFILCFYLSEIHDMFSSYRMRLKKRGLNACFIALVGVMICSRPVFSILGISNQNFVNRNGVLLNLTLDLNNKMINRVKSGSTLSSMNEVSEQYQSDVIEFDDDAPNIIVIMNETFSDLSTLLDLNTNIEVMPFFNSMTTNTIKGNVIVPVHGAGTPNSEFEFLTGNSMLNYTGYPFYSISRHQPVYSLASQMNELGYHTTFFHPFYSNGWNRPSVYEAFQFDDQKYLDDVSELEMLRTFPNDRCDYETIKAILESTDEKDFIFNVTIQNHGGYGEESLNGFEKNVYVEGKKGEYPQLETYLSLMNESDRALQEFITYFLDYEEPVMICMYGDHQPSFSIELLDELGMSANEISPFYAYTTPYFIWSNREIENKNLEWMSLNYLSSHLLDTANLPMTAFNKFLLDMYDKYPVISRFGIIDANDDYSIESNYDIETYQQVMNNQLRDLNYTVDTFFSYK